jgi:GDP-L-fucose synthase
VPFWDGKNVLVTGGTGLIGSHLVEMLIDKGAHLRTIVHSRPPTQIFPPRHLNKIEFIKGDLTRWESCKRAVKDMNAVFHLAAFVGGVGRNVAHPAGMYTPNMLMQTQMIEAARIQDVDRYLYTSSACIYPAKCKIPISEEEAWKGPPEPTNATYGWVKRMGELQAQAYANEYGMKIAVVRPFNAYGPRDNFDPETSHVTPGLIRKAIEKQNPFRVWGSGEPSRDFVYATDIARGMLLALEKYVVADPLNIATGREIKIKDLANLILKLADHKPPKIIFEKGKPLGQPRRRGSVAKAKKTIGFEAKVSLEEGLKRTIDWYRAWRQI